MMFNQRNNFRMGASAILTLLPGFSGNALALKDPENQGRWEQPCKEGPDAVVPGFLVNMGPTGARGILKERSYVVKFVFPKSPAEEILEIDDSEGQDGVLKLMVERGGEKMEVDVQLEVLGRFADTFPVDCEKTEILKARAYEYLMDNPGGISSQGRCVATLARLSSDTARFSGRVGRWRVTGTSLTTLRPGHGISGFRGSRFRNIIC